MDESEFTDGFTGDFLNEEPVVFKGLTDAEIKLVFVAALIAGAPVGILLALLIGIPMLILVFVFLFPVFAVFIIATVLERARRGKPPGYVEQKLQLLLAEKGLRSAEFIFETRVWGLGRQRDREK